MASVKEILPTKKDLTDLLERIIHWMYLAYIAVTLFQLWLYPDSQTGKELILTISVTVMLVVLLIYMLIVTYKLGVKSRYAETQSSMHICQHTLRDTYHYLSRCLSNDPPHRDIVFEESKLSSN